MGLSLFVLMLVTWFRPGWDYGIYAAIALVIYFLYPKMTGFVKELLFFSLLAVTVTSSVQLAGVFVVEFDAEVPDCAVERRMAEQKLEGPQVASLPIDQRGLGPSQGERPTGVCIEADRRHPVPDETGVLSRREMG